MIIDGFLNTFDELEKEAKQGTFSDEVNPIDGVVYPLINKNIPPEVESEILASIANIFGRKVDSHLMFMRKSPKGVHCPHQAHSDASMGEYSLMLYINDGVGGTSLLKHIESGISHNPQSQQFVDVVVRDQNKPEAWEVIDMVDMKPNRAFLFRSDAMHRAEPVGGFGEGEGARVVLTCFFS